MTTGQKMVWLSIGSLASWFIVMSVALSIGHELWGIGVGLVMVIVANTIVRCPRCHANVYRQETSSSGTVYSILNTTCYRCGLSFTKAYVAATDPDYSSWAADSPWLRVSHATAGVRSVESWARLVLTMIGVGIGYVNLRAAWHREMSWSALTIRGTLLGCAYLLLVVVVLKIVRSLETRSKRD